jgi:elongation factor Ts
MAISAKDVAALRAKTGAGMMECKKALEESNGNLEDAVQSLKERGLTVAAKKAERIAAEGLVDILYDEASKTAAMLEINIETDFAAKNAVFQEFLKDCLKIIFNERPAGVAELLTKKFNSETTVDEMLKEKIHVIGENMSIRRFVVAEGILSTYVHNKGAIGVIVKVEADDKAAAGCEEVSLNEVKKNIALQVASMNPLYISIEDVPASAIEAEKARVAEEFKEDPVHAKKPANIIEKMVEGKIKKYYADNCLLEQDYVKETKMSVAEYIADYNNKTGGQMKVAAFYRFAKGEGIEKREDNLAEEIAKLTGQK